MKGNQSDYQFTGYKGGHMKAIRVSCATLLATCPAAFAASGAETEGNALLVTAFLAFGALIIVFQLIPGLALFVSMLKGLFTRPAAEEAASAGDGNNAA